MARFDVQQAVAASVVLLAVFGFALGETDPVKVFAEPTRLAFRVGYLDREQPVEVLRMHKSWVLVRQGGTIGWAPLDRVENSFQIRWSNDMSAFPHRGFAPRVSGLDFGGDAWADQWRGFLEFAGGNLEQRRRMEELREGSRAQAVSSEWGPLFYRRTPHYYWKGIRLWEVLDDRLSLNLVKGKYHQQALFGGLSENLLDSIVDSNRGVLGNRNIFGKGRNYFFELRYTF